MGTFSSSPSSTAKLEPSPIDESQSSARQTPKIQKKESVKKNEEKKKQSQPNIETETKKQPQHTNQVLNPPVERKRDSVHSNFQPLRIQKTQLHVPEQKSQVVIEKQPQTDFFMRKAERKEKEVKRKSAVLMVEEMSDLEQETTPEKVVLKKDKKFRPQRMN